MKQLKPYHVDWIVAFVRPWDANFFVELAGSLREAAPMAPKIRYLTFWKETADRLRRLAKPEDEVVFLPDRMKRCELNDAEVTRLVALEHKLIDQGMTPLKMMMECERFAPTDSEAAEQFMWQTFSVLETLVPENTVLLSNQVDHVCYWIACGLCNVRGGRFFGFCVPGRPSDYTQVLRDATGLWTAHKPTKGHFAVVDQQIREIEDGVLPLYMAPRNPYPRLSDKIGVIRSRVEEARAGNYFMDWPTLLGPAVQKSRALKWKVLGSGVRHWQLSELNRPYVYFPLHLEPEASTSVYAPYFKYQDIIIEWLAKSLPAGVDLVLKENPKMWGNRSRGFYRRAARHPGVRWIDPETPSRDLTLGAKAVITITGTVAIESLALNIPVAILGHPPYSDAFQCIPRMRHPDDLVSSIAALLNSTVDRDTFRNEYAHYVANLVPVPFNNTRREPGTPYPVYICQPEHGAYVSRVLKWT